MSYINVHSDIEIQCLKKKNVLNVLIKEKYKDLKMLSRRSSINAIFVTNASNSRYLR